MAQEIERKFLIESLPSIPLRDYPCLTIRQGYISLPQDHSTVRVRQSDQKYYLTVKQSQDPKGLVRLEEELELSREEFLRLWGLCGSRTLEKKRYLIPWDAQRIELDIFQGKLHGLVMAEIEFPTVEESQQLILPDWFGPELTEDFRYCNSSLSFHGIPEKKSE